jgi:hypothetical protein
MVGDHTDDAARGKMNSIARLFIGLSLLVLFNGTISVASAFPAGRFIGAKDLTPGESLAVRRLTQSTGKKPWLILGFRFGTNPKPGLDRAELGVYLEPDVESGRLRRGRVLTIVFAPAGAGARSSWRVESVSNYAQVAVPGRPPRDVQGRWDIARPFPVSDEFGNRAVESLVDFIRASPEMADRPKDIAPRQVDGSVPIFSVRRTARGLEVNLQSEDWKGTYVVVEQRKDGWVVLEIHLWIASGRIQCPPLTILATVTA